MDLFSAAATAVAIASSPRLSDNIISKYTTALFSSLAVCVVYRHIWRKVTKGNPEVAFAPSSLDHCPHIDETMAQLPAPRQTVNLPTAVKMGPLKVRRVEPSRRKPTQDNSDTDQLPIVLVHDMWHGIWYFDKLQNILAEAGFTSYAIDLAPSPFRSWKDFVHDLVLTLKVLNLQTDTVIVGHGQGGLIIQTILRDPSLVSELSIKGAAILASSPLSASLTEISPVSQKRRIRAACRNIFTEMGFFGIIVYICFGRVASQAIVKRLFFLPTTCGSAVCCAGGLEEYNRRILAAPSDGWPSMQHWITHTPNFKHLSSHVRVLVVSADKDKMYPHVCMGSQWQLYFPHHEHMLVSDQAHSLSDADWEHKFAAPFVAWLKTFSTAASSCKSTPQ